MIETPIHCRRCNNRMYLVATIQPIGNEPVGSTPDEFDARFRADIAKFARIVKEARIPTQD